MQPDQTQDVHEKHGADRTRPIQDIPPSDATVPLSDEQSYTRNSQMSDETVPLGDVPSNDATVPLGDIASSNASEEVNPDETVPLGDVTASNAQGAGSSASDRSQLHENLILGRYRPLEQAGEGGFSTVQVAWDTRIQRKVAIKCMPLPSDDPMQEVSVSPAKQAGATHAFAYDAARVPGLEEARTAAMLSDPHIVGVHDFAVQNNMAYLIMEYVDGASLAQVLQAYPDQISLDVIGAVFQSVSQALEIAHENGVLHLDIKPDNVLIDHKGDVKVADFGLSRLANAAGYVHAAGGTIGYMPPEQMQQQDLDQRCDEWALAAMIYEMIAGQNPFRADTIPDSLASIYDGEVPLPHLCMDGIDPAVDDVLFYALDPDASQRYDTVQDFAEVLQPYLGSPRRGKKQLAHMINMLTNDDSDDTEEQSSMPDQQGRGEAKPLYTDFTEPNARVRKHLSPDTVGTLIMRVLVVVSVGIITFVALSNSTWISSVVQFFSQTGTAGQTATTQGLSAPGGLGNSSSASSTQAGAVQPLFWIVLITVCVVAGFLPQLGVLIALCLFALAALTQSQFVAAAVIAGIACLWFFSAASDDKNSAAHASSALWGSMNLSMLSPLVVGWATKDAERAAINAAGALVVALCFAALGSNSLFGWNLGAYYNSLNGGFQTRLLSLVMRPSTWFIGISWCASAAMMAYGMDHTRRATQVVYAVCAALILVAGVMLGAWFSSSFRSITPAQDDFAFTILAGVIGCALPFVPTETTEEAPQSDLR